MNLVNPDHTLIPLFFKFHLMLFFHLRLCLSSKILCEFIVFSVKYACSIHLTLLDSFNITFGVEYVL